MSDEIEVPAEFVIEDTNLPKAYRAGYETGVNYVLGLLEVAPEDFPAWLAKHQGREPAA